MNRKNTTSAPLPKPKIIDRKSTVTIDFSFPRSANGLVTQCAIQNPHTNKIIKGKAAWDTGATISAINTKLIGDLDLNRIGYQDVNTAAGVVDKCPVVMINIFFAQNIYVTRNVTCLDLDEDILILIGMDVIRRGYFSIENKPHRNQLRFRFTIPFELENK